MRNDLTSVFQVVVAALDVIAIVALVALRAGPSILVGIAFLLVANACVPHAVGARLSISRLWSAMAQ